VEVKRQFPGPISSQLYINIAVCIEGRRARKPHLWEISGSVELSVTETEFGMGLSGNRQTLVGARKVTHINV
jgi:hypothetical protein